MLKNKFKIITLFLILALTLSLMLPIVRAENETNDASTVVENSDASIEDVQQAAENAANQNETIDNSFKKNDVYLIDDNVTIDYVIDGNLFVIANSVTINSQIGGDAFILANSINVEKEGYIFSNLFAACKTLDVKGVVYDIYSVSNNTTISGYVYRDIKLASNTLNIFGTIGRNAFVNCSNMNFVDEKNNENNSTTPTGTISGNLEYSSKNEISIPENIVRGNINYTQTDDSKDVDTSNPILDTIYEIISIVIATLVIWLICSKLTPEFIENLNILDVKKDLIAAGIGIATPIISTIASILLLIISPSIGFSLIGALIILLIFSTAISLIAINKIVCEKFNLDKTIQKLGILSLLTVIYSLIKLIPYIGSILSFVTSILGLGFVVYAIFYKIKAKN